MSRRYHTMANYEELGKSDVRHYFYLTPAGIAVSDLVALVIFAVVSGATLFTLTLAILMVFFGFSFLHAFHWALAAFLLPVAVLGLVSLRLIAALCISTLERITGIDLDASGEVGDQRRPEIRLIPVWRSDVPTINGVDRDDLVYFIKTITQTGDWTQRTWRGKRMPSGRVCDNEYHQALCRILENAGVIVDRGPRTSGRLLTTDAARILRLLRLT